MELLDEGERKDFWRIVDEAGLSKDNCEKVPLSCYRSDL